MALIIVGVAGCGGGQSAAVQGTPSANPSSGTSAGSQPGTGASTRPGASGTVAAISGSDLEVQNPTDGQVTVHLTGTTKIIATVPATAADVKVGGCAVVQPAISRTPGGTSSAAPPSVDPAAPVAARSVTLTDAVAGSCTAGPRGLRGPGGSPSGSPSARPTNAPRTGSGAFRGRSAAGLITAVTAGGFTVRSAGRTGNSTLITVTTTAQTTYSRSQNATPAAIKVGSCVVAQGSVDSTGAVTASSLAVQAPTASGCRTGFGRRQGGSVAPSPAAGSLNG